VSARRPSWRLAAAAAIACVCAGAARADAPGWRVSHADVRVTCRLTVGGSFEARTAALTGAVAPTSPRPPAFGGSLALDLRTLETGIGLRDQHMRDTYLEVGRGEGFDTAVLSDLRLGDVDLQSFRGRTEFTGTLLLHGVRKPVTGKVEVRRGGDAVDLQATFPVTLSEFGIARPAYLGVGVADVVQVKVALSAQPAAVSASTR
jgi:polyisoprenoid-binding protein YceI